MEGRRIAHEVAKTLKAAGSETVFTEAFPEEFGDALNSLWGITGDVSFLISYYIQFPVRFWIRFTFSSSTAFSTLTEFMFYFLVSN